MATGDSFTLQFDVEVDPREISAALVSQIEGSASGVDASGNPILDSAGNQIIGSDLSDSGTDPGTSNPDDPSDQGTSDDPTLFDPPPVPLSAISGTVFQDDNNDGFQQLGEGGIGGVILTLTGTDVFGDAVSIQTTTDATGRYVFAALNAGEYSITQTQPDGFTDGIDIDSNGLVTPINDVLSNISLGFGETISSATFAERQTGASGNPPTLPGLPPIANTPIGNSAGSFVSASGSIYSGVPINSNADSLSLDSTRPITGGYSYSIDGPKLSRPLIWSLADNPQLTSPTGNSTYRVWLDGPINSGQTATVQIIRDSDFQNIDVQAIRQAISVAVKSYDGPGLLSFNGRTLTYQSTDGQLMSPLNIEMPVEGASPDEMFDLHNSGNSEITPENLPADQSASEASEKEQDSSVRIDLGVSFLKRFTNWLSPSNHIES